MVAHVNPSTQEQRQVDFYEFKTSLVCTVSSMTAWATKRDPVSKREKERDVSREMLRTLETLLEDLGSNPRTHKSAHNHLLQNRA